MLQAGAIVLGAAIIAAAILFTFRWEIAGTAQMPLLLDRWNGYVNVCNAKSGEASRAQREETGAALVCSEKP